MAAAARTAYWSLLPCRPRKRHSGKNRSRMPSRAAAGLRRLRLRSRRPGADERDRHTGAAAARRQPVLAAALRAAADPGGCPGPVACGADMLLAALAAP